MRESFCPRPELMSTQLLPKSTANSSAHLCARSSRLRKVAADQVAAIKVSDYLPRRHLALSIRSSWLVFAPDREVDHRIMHSKTGGFYVCNYRREWTYGKFDCKTSFVRGQAGSSCRKECRAIGFPGFARRRGVDCGRHG